MGWNPSHELIVFLVICGCVVFVFIGYALARLYGGDSFDGPGLPGMTPEQASYMREVRLRNREDMFHALQGMEKGHRGMGIMLIDTCQ
ncbi:uncharacterized protein BO66DRAFT_471346 [Aspergillus aculeatinus CBS 121060]|uniref:Uncharacterized protein n=1 Tax=Aspergillus aculeatinus CBS 121060 TaxID=1448322 RepID=A0ACD1H9R9_9EURO|nr:hypothetical protein BO66DRAFT_471346 [Aspergillus aculeatinus CBS 121060]RAH70346.1 hypothetical protein BO66DRAFT_471346 [Aspergillus aculeatinus CBS 121060]